MRRVLVASVGLLALSAAMGAAQAADLNRRYAPPPIAPVYAPIYNWTGFYVGINGGGGWGRSKWDTVDTFDLSGGLIGGTIGYNWQLPASGLGRRRRHRLVAASRAPRRRCVPSAVRPATLARHRARPRSATRSTASCRIVTGGLGRRRHQGQHAVASPAAARPPPAGPSAAALEFAHGRQRGRAKAEYLYVDLGSFNCGAHCGCWRPATSRSTATSCAAASTSASDRLPSRT